MLRGLDWRQESVGLGEREALLRDGCVEGVMGCVQSLCTAHCKIYLCCNFQSFGQVLLYHVHCDGAVQVLVLLEQLLGEFFVLGVQLPIQWSDELHAADLLQQFLVGFRNGLEILCLNAEDKPLQHQLEIQKSF